MTPRPPHPDDIPRLPMKRGATVTRTRFGYEVRYSYGFGIGENSWRPTRAAAERDARRFVKGSKSDATVVSRHGADNSADGTYDLDYGP